MSGARYESVMPVVDDLEQLVDLLREAGPEEKLYVRWSRGPDADLSGECGAGQSSRDALTGIDLPGLSANPLAVESWWGNRPLRLWVARRLYDYCHLRELRGPGVRPWVLIGEQCGRGPDNEPLVRCHRPVAWVSERALREADRAVEEQASAEWGPLHRAD
ncbi:DUF6098 family protein [Micromonospora phytophila]|uniref:DUF6098 family protein n=1 Tax=Micromonospora phytophila TaxID=709888 RepID=UPI00202E72BE|nr:DUF6098 family protein [Micromonospora phytophila]MCM0677224.1 DUF6098 family protein [Micromonospora phytophila]